VSEGAEPDEAEPTIERIWRESRNIATDEHNSTREESTE